MIGILAAGWGSGSKLLQRMLMHEAFIWGEPYGHAGLIEGLLQPNLSFTARWPEKHSLYQGEPVEELAERMSAELYPRMEYLQAAQRAWFEEMFGKPARQAGRARWGLAEVRLSVANAEWLKALYPEAKLLFLIRNPYDAYRAFAAQKQSGSKTYRKWPHEPVTAPLFGAHWRELTSGFLSQADQLGARVIRYEELLDGKNWKEIEDYLEFRLDRKAFEASLADPASLAEIPQLEQEELMRRVEPLASQIGYVDHSRLSSRLRNEAGMSGKFQTPPREKCVVLVPVGSHIEPRCDDALHELERRGYKVWRVRGYSAIDQGRNQMATDALAAGFEETLWIDSDVAFHPDDVDRLRSHPEPIMCGIYPKKGKRELAVHVLPGTSRLTFGKRGGLTELKYAATGFLLVRRVVYETMQRQLQLPVCNLQFGHPMVPYFQPLVTDGTASNPLNTADAPGKAPWYLAEDFAFCERARRCGFRIMADTSIRLFHIGSYPYSWEEAGHEVRRFETFDFNLADGLAKPPTTTAPSVPRPNDSPAVVARGHDGIQALRHAYPWPSQRPDLELPPYEAGPSDEVGVLLQEVLTPQIRLIVELGAGDGSRTELCASLASQATILACDRWPDDEGTLHFTSRKRAYLEFQARCWGHRERIIPMRSDLPSAVERLNELKLRPDVIYWDGDRDYDGVRKNISRILECSPQSLVMGSDYDWPGVELALIDAVKNSKRRLQVKGTAWSILPLVP